MIVTNSPAQYLNKTTDEYSDETDSEEPFQCSVSGNNFLVLTKNNRSTHFLIYMGYITYIS
ncbi:hypothetical protein Vspart_03443 [Vibrio spartinae]|uniref:Uncharacterized protein n=1 Tax=Vibrio spartinae TaxID=1918945 RepID=A0ABX6R407_9VIBR|nr:hypothetical protein Vspart_03443 [Vibrio spartinae]